MPCLGTTVIEYATTLLWHSGIVVKILCPNFNRLNLAVIHIELVLQVLRSQINLNWTNPVPLNNHLFFLFRFRWFLDRGQFPIKLHDGADIRVGLGECVYFATWLLLVVCWFLRGRDPWRMLMSISSHASFNFDILLAPLHIWSVLLAVISYWVVGIDRVLVVSWYAYGSAVRSIGLRLNLNLTLGVVLANTCLVEDRRLRHNLLINP